MATACTTGSAVGGLAITGGGVGVAGSSTGGLRGDPTAGTGVGDLGIASGGVGMRGTRGG